MGVVALTAGLALLTFTKAFGIATLARPRTPTAAAAREGSWTMRLAMLLAAAGVLAVGLIPGVLVRAISPVLPEAARPTAYSAGLVLPGARASLDPTALALLGDVAEYGPARACNTQPPRMPSHSSGSSMTHWPRRATSG